MPDPRAAAAARVLRGIRFLLAFGIVLSVVWLFSSGSAGHVAVLACLLLAGLWWLIEWHARLGAASDPLSSADSPLAAPTEPRDDAAVAMLNVSSFISSQSHDLRQPAQAISLFAATLAAQSLPEPARKLVAGIEAASVQMTEQLEAVFAIAKLEAGRVEVRLTEVDLDGLMAQTVGVHLEDAQERGLHLRHVPTRRRVMADPALLGRALDRVVVHALRATREGGVVVGCRRHGDRICIEVWDSSPGVAAEHLPGMFKAGARHAQHSVDRGLGLVYADHALRRFGASLRARSRVGHGTVIVIDLPGAAV